MVVIQYAFVLFGLWGVALSGILIVRDGDARHRTLRGLLIGVIGLALTLGWASFMHLLQPVFIWMLVGFGWVALILTIRQTLTRNAIETPIKAIWPYPVLGSLLAGMLLSPGLETEVLNPHDDLAKYLAHPVKIIQTGTAFRGELGSVDIQVLGLWPALQAFPLLVVEMGILPSFDSLLAGGLLLIACHAVFWRNKFAGTSHVLMALAIFYAFDLMYVNVSALYLPVVVGLLVWFSARGIFERADFASSLSWAAVLGMGAALPVALKLSHIFIPLIICAGLVPMALRHGAPRAFLLGLAFTLGALFTLLPWLLPQFARIWEGFTTMGENEGSLISFSFGNLMRALDPSVLFYSQGGGSNFLHTATLVIIGVIPLASRRLRSSAHFSSLCAAWIVFALAYTILISSNLMTSESLPRYIAPSLLFISMVIAGELALVGTPGKRRRETSLALGLSCVLIASQANQFAFRLCSQFDHGTMLAFPAAQSSSMRLHTQTGLSKDTADGYALMQETVPEGAGIATYVGFPHLIDYARNEVADIQPTGLTGGAQRFPVNGTAQDVVQYFLDRDTEYFIYQYAGPFIREREYWRSWASSESAGRRVTGENMMKAVGQFDEIAASCRRIASNTNFVVVDFTRCRFPEPSTQNE